MITVAAAALGLLHALAVAPSYHVGSFDDDASYLMTARALADGIGLSGTLPAGYPLIGTYPPGFALLLSPLALVAGTATWPYRALVLCFFLASFPLVHLWLRRVGMHAWLRAAVLLLLALNPVTATFATMVMAEAPFLVVVLALFLVAARWNAPGIRALSASGIGTVVLAAALLWLKEAGVGLVAGLALWLLLQRRWGRALGLVAAVAAAFAPVLVLRAVGGTPLVGSRYSSEIGGNLRLGAVPGALHDYLWTALPRSVVPLIGVPPGVFLAVYVSVPAFVVLGIVVWLRRCGGPAAAMTLVYFAETMVYPYVNERRVVLVLPVVLAWYVVGARQFLHALDVAAGRWGQRFGPGRSFRPGRPLAVLGVLLLVAPLAWQFDRNFMFGPGQQSSQPLGSAYLRFVAAVTDPGDVVETPFIWTTSLGTGRRTANGLFVAECSPHAMRAAAARDGAGFVVDAAFGAPPPLSDCEHDVLDAATWAVPLYRTPLDDAVVYELVGPGTAHPALTDAVQGPGAPAVSVGTTTLSWHWPTARQLTQLSVGAASPITGTASEVRIEWRAPDGRWHRAAAASGPVGPAAARAFLLWQPTAPFAATGVRIVVAGGAGIRVQNVHALTAGEQ